MKKTKARAPRRKAQEKKQKTPETLMELWSWLDNLGFKRVSEAEKISELVNEGLNKPERATEKNVLQDEFRYVCKKTQMMVIIQTASIKGRLNPKGVASIRIRDIKRKKNVLFREYYKITFSGIAKRLAVYAVVYKNIAEDAVPGIILVETPLGDGAWEMKRNKRQFVIDFKEYTMGLSLENRQFFLNKENTRRSYMRATESLVEAGDMVRQRTIQKTWKSKK